MDKPPASSQIPLGKFAWPVVGAVLLAPLLFFALVGKKAWVAMTTALDARAARIAQFSTCSLRRLSISALSRSARDDLPPPTGPSR